MSANMNPYTVLGLTSSASSTEASLKLSIKEAYRRLCLQHHPDLCPPDQRAAAERYFKEITAAYTKVSRHAPGGSYASSSATQAQWARAAYTAAAANGGPTKYSNGVVGAVIAAPLLLLGMWLQHKSRNIRNIGDNTRPHGILHPPQNPFLRDDMKPRMQSRFWNNGWNGKNPTKNQMGSPPKRPETNSGAPAVADVS